MKKCVLFRTIFACPYSRSRINQIVTYWTEVFRKLFCEGVQLCFEISLSSFVRKIFEQNLSDMYKPTQSSYGLIQMRTKKRLLFHVET